MLAKNVYIIYPAGYHGNYFKWAIESSDLDLMGSGEIPEDPINKSTSTKWGGVGTSHKSIRMPTHATYDTIVQWIIYNRPTIKKVYVINAGGDDIPEEKTSHEISNLLIQDPTGIVIHLNNSDDPDVSSYGIINAVIKWPTYLVATLQCEDYDPYNCAGNIVFRNRVAKGEIRLGSSNVLSVGAIDKRMAYHEAWFKGRHEYQPHELDPKYYPHNIEWKNRYFAFSCKEVVSEGFPEKVRNLLLSTGISDNYDTTPVEKVHNEFISIQQNLQWFDSVKNWETNGVIDVYIRSHSIIQAEILKRMFKAANMQKSSYDEECRFLQFYYTHHAEGWPYVKNEFDFFSLPERIQTELKELGIQLKYTSTPWPKMASLNWEELSIDEINAVFQEERSQIL